jgi:hypothetical protein
MRTSNRLAVTPLWPLLRGVAAGLALSVVAPGCGGEAGSVHFDKPADARSIGVPSRPAPSPSKRPARPAAKKAVPFLPG